MTKALLNSLLTQQQMTNGFTLNQVSVANSSRRLNPQTASVGFIYRHIGETIHLLATFLGESPRVQNTTMGQQDTGQGNNVEESHKILADGLALLQQLIDTHTDEWWLETIDTPFFGRVNRLRLFSHILYHNAHHTGQIALTLAKGA